MKIDLLHCQNITDKLIKYLFNFIYLVLTLNFKKQKNI